MLGGCQVWTAADLDDNFGSGKVATESRAVKNFQQVFSNLPGDLELKQGDRESLTITAEDNILPKIETRVVNGLLELTLKKNEDIQTNEPIEVDLQLKNLNQLDLSGAGMVKAPKLQTNRLAISSDGTTDIEIDFLQVKQLVLDFSGTGRIKLSGRADKQEVSLSGVGEYDASNLKTQNTEIELTGAGSARIWAENFLNVEVSGTGQVGYYGNPQLTEDVSGVGIIKHLGNPKN